MGHYKTNPVIITIHYKNTQNNYVISLIQTHILIQKRYTNDTLVNHTNHNIYPTKHSQSPNAKTQTILIGK